MTDAELLELVRSFNQAETINWFNNFVCASIVEKHPIPLMNSHSPYDFIRGNVRVMKTPGLLCSFENVKRLQINKLYISLLLSYKKEFNNKNLKNFIPVLKQLHRLLTSRDITGEDSSAIKTVCNLTFSMLSSDFSVIKDDTIKDWIIKEGNKILECIICDSKNLGIDPLYADTDFLFYIGDDISVDIYMSIGIDSEFISYTIEDVDALVLSGKPKQYVTFTKDQVKYHGYRLDNIPQAIATAVEDLKVTIKLKMLL
jgi:hypothetical protein